MYILLCKIGVAGLHGPNENELLTRSEKNQLEIFIKKHKWLALRSPFVSVNQKIEIVFFTLDKNIYGNFYKIFSRLIKNNKNTINIS